MKLIAIFSSLVALGLSMPTEMHRRCDLAKGDHCYYEPMWFQICESHYLQCVAKCPKKNKDFCCGPHCELNTCFWGNM
jgi:hypothetical protein